MGADWVLRRAVVGGFSEPVDVRVADGRIAAIAPSAAGFACDAPAVDAGGRFVSPGLVETHIHLDKAGILGRCRLCEGTLAEAVRETAAAKAGFTAADVHARATAVVERAALSGTTRMRSFVEIDPRAGFRSFEALRQVREDWAGVVDITLCAFAQEGLTQEPETEAMLAAALAEGADLVGGCPYTDPDPDGHVRRIFDLADRFAVPVDFHLDFDLDPTVSTLPTVVAETRRRGMGGRVSVGHVTKLSMLAPDALAAAGRAMAEAGVAVTVLPATDLFLTGRDRTHAVPRGVAPAHRLAAMGVVASIATNNVMNPFTPFGDASLVRMANLYATVAQVGTEQDLAGVHAMIEADAARLTGRDDHAVRVGGPADLVLFDAPSAAATVAGVAAPLAVWRAGRRTVDRPPGQVLRG